MEQLPIHPCEGELGILVALCNASEVLGPPSFQVRVAPDDEGHVHVTKDDARECVWTKFQLQMGEYKGEVEGVRERGIPWKRG